MHSVQKRGMTPLIATVLLIGFTVALAAVVMTWGFDFVKKQQDRVKDTTDTSLMCTNDLGFKIEVDCANDKIAVDNTGTVDIVKLQLRKDMGGDITPVTVEQLLTPGAKKWFSDLGALSGVTTVDVVATIKTKEGKEIICADAKREADANCP